MSTYSPFSKMQLLPQEEKLEIARHKSDLFIGIPKETSYQERRICLTPDAVSSLTSHGHRVMIEAGAGLSSSYSDKEYSDAGAEVTNDTKKVLSCPMLLKVEPPTLEEIEMMNQEAIVISAIQLKTQKKEYFDALAQKRITALAFEFIKDEDGSYPAVKSLSEIISLRKTFSLVEFGSSIPTVFLPGIVAILADSELVFLAISSDKLIILETLTPAAGSNSLRVTTGP